jgi:hypothetical protein
MRRSRPGASRNVALCCQVARQLDVWLARAMAWPQATLWRGRCPGCWAPVVPYSKVRGLIRRRRKLRAAESKFRPAVAQHVRPVPSHGRQRIATTEYRPTTRLDNRIQSKPTSAILPAIRPAVMATTGSVAFHPIENTPGAARAQSAQRAQAPPAPRWNVRSPDSRYHETVVTIERTIEAALGWSTLLIAAEKLSAVCFSGRAGL